MGNSDPRQQSHECSFCQESITGTLFDPVLSMIGMPAIDRVVCADGDFFVVPSLGPLCEGHLLLVTKKHYPALRDAPETLRRQAINSAFDLAAAMKVLLGKEILIFENGEVNNQVRKSACVDHVHLRLLPVTAEELQAMRADEAFPPEVTAADTESVFRGLSPLQDYLVVLSTDGKIYMKESPEILSQWMRRFLSRYMSVSEWNWRDRPGLGLVTATLERLRGRISLKNV